MKTILFYISLFFFTITVTAHQTNVSTTMLVEKENNIWVLQITASLTAFQQEIKKHFAETPYKTPEEFQHMVIEHIKKHFEIKLNNNQIIKLINGQVLLGHETKVIFEVIGIPANIESLTITNSAFRDIYKNQSALVILKEGFNKEHFVLNNANNHSLNILVANNKFIVKTQNETGFMSTTMLGVLLTSMLVGCIAMFIKGKRQQNNYLEY